MRRGLLIATARRLRRCFIGRWRALRRRCFLRRLLARFIKRPFEFLFMAGLLLRRLLRLAERFLPRRGFMTAISYKDGAPTCERTLAGSDGDSWSREHHQRQTR